VKTKLLSICIVLLGLFVACTPPPEEMVSSPMEVTDQSGRIVKLDKIPETIVSLAPSNTELLFALGLGGKVVGVTDYCDYPEAAKEKPKVGGFSTVDMERVVEMQPDLILAANIHQEEVIPALEKAGLTVVCLDPANLEEVLEAVTLAGQCTGEEDEASRLVAEMSGRIETIRSKVANLTEVQKPRVFAIMWHDPLMSVGLGLRHDLIVEAGGINIVEELGEEYPTVSLEWVIDKNPEVIIAGVGMGSGEDLTFQFALNEERLAGVDARRNNRVYQIDLDLIGRSGPRIVQGFELVAKMIHPEIFGEIE
jgi:iron complex transport system substrate-binding protein